MGIAKTSIPGDGDGMQPTSATHWHPLPVKCTGNFLSPTGSDRCALANFLAAINSDLTTPGWIYI